MSEHEIIGANSIALIIVGGPVIVALADAGNHKKDEKERGKR
jgi:hypothetical protein